MNSSVLAVERAANDFYQFATLQTINIPDENLPRAEIEIPEELAAGGDIPNALHTSGQTLADALHSTSAKEVKDTLSTLLKLEHLANAVPDLSTELGGAGNFVVTNAANKLDEIIAGDDREVSADALRFICHRALSGNYQSGQLLRRHVYKIINKPDKKLPANDPFTKLYDDLMATLPKADARHLRDAFMQGLGYGPFDAPPDRAWDTNGEDKDREAWYRRNLDTIISLEQLEKGLSRKITQEFRINNFARFTPKMLKAMYDARQQKPGQAYAEFLVATADHNFAFDGPGYYEDIFFKLQKAGIGMEIHECGSLPDIDHAAAQAEWRHTEHGGAIKDLVIEAHSHNASSAGLAEGVLINSGSLYRLEPLSASFADQTRIFLNSCSAGRLIKGKCLAQTISGRLRRVTEAPIDNLSVRLKVDGAGNLSVHYSKVDKRNLVAANLSTMLGTALILGAEQVGIRIVKPDNELVQIPAYGAIMAAGAALVCLNYLKTKKMVLRRLGERPYYKAVFDPAAVSSPTP